jgi:hypothetical protein
MRFARGVVSAPPSFPWHSIFLMSGAGKTPNTNVLAIKQVRAFCSLLVSAYVFFFGRAEAASASRVGW